GVEHGVDVLHLLHLLFGVEIVVEQIDDLVLRHVTLPQREGHDLVHPPAGFDLLFFLQLLFRGRRRHEGRSPYVLSFCSVRAMSWISCISRVASSPRAAASVDCRRRNSRCKRRTTSLRSAPITSARWSWSSPPADASSRASVAASPSSSGMTTP